MLSRTMQIQACADLLRGLPGRRKYCAAEFQEPWATAHQVLLCAGAGQGAQALGAALDKRSDYPSIVSAILAAAPGQGPEPLPDFTDVLALIPDVEWLWRGWIPQGMLTLLGAAAGIGKSYLALDLTHRVLTGAPFPGEPAEACREPATVLYLDAERCEQMLKMRVMAWPDRPRGLFVLEPPPTDIFDLSEQGYRDMLMDKVEAHRPKLLVVDSFSGISTRGENSIEEVRQVMAFLTSLAADAGCALLVLHHLRKLLLQAFAEDLTQDDFRGSTHLTAAPRSVLGLTQVQTGPKRDRNGPRKLELVKTNFGKYPEPFGIEFIDLEPSGVELRFGEAATRYHEPSRADNCAKWLLATLTEAGEPMRPRKLVELGEALGYTRIMIYRAREALGSQIANTDGARSPLNKWVVAPAAETA